MSHMLPQTSGFGYPISSPYYHQTAYQQVPQRVSPMEANAPELSYQKAPALSMKWIGQYRTNQGQGEEMLSPISHNNYPLTMQPQVGPGPPVQYATGPILIPNTSIGVQVPRTTQNDKGAYMKHDDSYEVVGEGQHFQIIRKVSTPSSMAGAVPKPNSPSKSDIKNHKHESSNVCKECGKSFQKPYNLKSHMKTHSSERPFKCQFCPKTFARSHDRKRHENLHKGQKNYKCEGYLQNGVTKWGCGKAFARSDALSRHFRTEAGHLCIKKFMEEKREWEMAEKESIRRADNRYVEPYSVQPGQQMDPNYRVSDMVHGSNQISLPRLLWH